LGKVAMKSEFAVVRWSVPWLWADFVHVSRFIDEIVVILTDNDVTAQDHLKTLKFEYLAWPEKVSGASLLVARHLVVYAFAGVGMKKAFICEALKEYALAFPDPRQQVASVPALGGEAGTVVGDELRLFALVSLSRRRHCMFVVCREQNRALKAIAFGKTKEFVHVDMCSMMEKEGLDKLFPVVCWPEARAVRVACEGVRVPLASRVFAGGGNGHEA
jgi:hypothetical protein